MNNIANIQAEITEIQANIALCAPDMFGRYPYGKQQLEIWLEMESSKKVIIYNTIAAEFDANGSAPARWYK